jgi:short-subunit dehydrogenase
MNLKGKRVLLTGATGGLGQALAAELAKKGAQLALVGRDEVKLNLLKDTLVKAGAWVTSITADLSESGVNIQITEAAKQKMGSIDILINNAGVLDFTKFEQQSDARIAQMLHTNVTAPIQLTHAVIADFIAKNQGHIVFVGSIFGSLGFPHFATYCASKFAIHGFSQSLRRELLGSNIGITYIAPRGIKTAMNDASTVAMWEKTGSQMDDPQTVAKRIIQALEKEQQEVFIGQPQSFFAWLNGVCPALVNLGLKKTTLIARQFL